MSFCTSLVGRINSALTTICQKISAMLIAPSRAQFQVTLLVLGLALIASGISLDVIAQDVGSDQVGEYNDERIGEAINRLFGYIEGSFGALIMVAAGLGAIMAAALGSYSAAISLLVVAVGSFILRSLVDTFFNDESIQ